MCFILSHFTDLWCLQTLIIKPPAHVKSLSEGRASIDHWMSEFDFQSVSGLRIFYSLRVYFTTFDFENYSHLVICKNSRDWKNTTRECLLIWCTFRLASSSIWYPFSLSSPSKLRTFGLASSSKWCTFSLSSSSKWCTISLSSSSKWYPFSLSSS